MKLRIFTEPTGDGYQWSIDYYVPDHPGAYSDRCWSYDTFAEAFAALPEFVAAEQAHPSMPREWREQDETP